MAINVSLLRLLPPLLLLLPPPLRDYLLAATHQVPREFDRHPIILFPGFSCSDLEARLTDIYTPSLPRCGALKGKGWFPLSKQPWDVVHHGYVPCFEEQMSLRYDPVLNDYQNLPAVETRVPNFGSAYFTSKIDTDLEVSCLRRLRKEVKILGYRNRDSLFGAPYDVRHAPPPVGQPSKVYSDYYASVKELVPPREREERGQASHPHRAQLWRQGRPRLHINSTPLRWRKIFIKHMILISTAPPTGFTEVVMNLASGSEVIIPTVPLLDLRPMWRTFGSSLLSLPSPTVFGHKPLVITKNRNYSAYDFPDFLAALGFSIDGIVPFMKRVLPTMLRIEAPMVPTTYISGVSIQTPVQVVYWEGNFDVAPEIVHGDGDGNVNLVSVLAFAKKLRRQQRQNNIHFKFVKIDHATHTDIIIQKDSLRRVMAEVLEANI